MDFFDFVFALLRLVDASEKVTSTLETSVNRVCQTLAVLGQRLVARLTASRDMEAKALVGQALHLIADIDVYVEQREVSANHCLRRLSASLEIVAKSLTCHLEQNSDEAEIKHEEKT